MEKKYEITLSKEEVEKIAKLNNIEADKVDNLDVEWTIKLLLKNS